MKLVILDRDGVINQDSADYIKSVDEWQAIPESLTAIAQLNQAGYQVAVVTNQSGLGRGLFSEADLNAMHDKMQQQLQAVGGEIASIFYCPHHPDEACNCRKPKAGLFLQVADYFNGDLSGVLSVGDSLRDLQATQAVNAKPVLVLTGKGQKTQAQLQQLADTHPLKNTPIYSDLNAVVQQFLA